MERYSALFQISPDVVARTLENLRENAVRKLAANRKFKASGVATIKVKLIGKSSGIAHTGMSKLETGLHVDGETFRKKVIGEFGLQGSHEDIRLISHGKLISHGNSVILCA